MSTFTEYDGSGVYVCDPEPPADGGRTLNDNFRALVDRDAGLGDALAGHAADDAAHAATAANTAGRIVARDGSGNVAVGELAATRVVNAGGTYYTAGNAQVVSQSPTATEGIVDLVAGPFFAGGFGTCAAAIRVQGNGTAADGTILFKTNLGNVGAGVRMIITSAGNVGVGTTSPAALLDVAGTAQATRFVGDGVCPVGTVAQFAGSSAPAAWLACDGSAVSRTTYADLFAVVGTTYGAGDGSTTFNVPTLAGGVGAGYVVKA